MTIYSLPAVGTFRTESDDGPWEVPPVGRLPRVARPCGKCPMHASMHFRDSRVMASDYATYRPGYPDSVFRKLAALDIGMPGQRILDLGTGTGVGGLVHAART